MPEKRTVSPLKLSKLPLSSAAPNHNSAHHVDMKNLFGDDDDDDDDSDEANDAAAAAVTVAVEKDDSQHKTDHVRPAEKGKKHSLHGYRKTPEKAHSSKAHTPVVKGRSDKTDTQSFKATNSLSSSHSSDKHHRHHSESGVDKRSRDAAKSGKPVAVATKSDSATPVVTGSKPMTSDSAAKSVKMSRGASTEKTSRVESVTCEGDLSLSDSDTSNSSESNDVDVCDSQPEKPPSTSENQRHESDPAATVLPPSSHEAKAANGEYIAVLLELQKQLMSIADDETLERLTTMVEETGKYSITTNTFDFDLCQLDIHTVNKLKHFLATVAY